MEIFKIGQLPVQEVVVLEKEDKEFVIDLKTGIDSASLIGHRGEVMWALQHIVKNVLKTQNLLEEGEHVKIDVDSYRLKQEENVVSRADQVAKRVLEEGKAIIMPPMSPFFEDFVICIFQRNTLNSRQKAKGLETLVL